MRRDLEDRLWRRDLASHMGWASPAPSGCSGKSWCVSNEAVASAVEYLAAAAAAATAESEWSVGCTVVGKANHRAPASLGALSLTAGTGSSWVRSRHARDAAASPRNSRCR
jgi:hypothetical protein